MVVLTRDEKRRRVLELHDEDKGTREIAKILRMSFRDIGEILNTAATTKESGQRQAQQQLLSSKAYQLYSEGKSPTEVAIELNIRSSHAIMFQKEFWELKALHELNLIYEQIRDAPWPFVNLYKFTMAEGMSVSHVLMLLKIANNDLPGLEHRYNFLKQEVKSLEEKKRDLYNQATEEGSNLEYCRAACQRVKAICENLQLKRIKAEALVRQFEKNNSEYVKIRRTVEEKVCAMLSDAKPFIYLGLDCLIESIKANPDKYSPLVIENRPPTSFYNPIYPYYAEYPRVQQQHANYFDMKTMLADEAARMYEVLSKDLAEEILDNYSVTRSQQTYLPLPPNLEKKEE